VERPVEVLAPGTTRLQVGGGSRMAASRLIGADIHDEVDIDMQEVQRLLA
jgi:hypothetical protein